MHCDLYFDFAALCLFSYKLIVYLSTRSKEHKVSQCCHIEPHAFNRLLCVQLVVANTMIFKPSI